MNRVDTWELVAAVALFAGRPRTVRGARYQMSAYRIAVALNKLARIARTLHRLYEDGCNGTIGNSEALLDYSKWESVVARYEARAVKIGKELGIVVSTQRDPRGAAVNLWADREDGRRLGCFS